MALGYCIECKGNLSTKATSCPHCGYPGGGIIRTPKAPETKIITSSGRNIDDEIRYNKQQYEKAVRDEAARWSNPTSALHNIGDPSY